MHASFDRSDSSLRVTVHKSRSASKYGLARFAVDVAVLAGMVAVAWMKEQTVLAICLVAAGSVRVIWQRSKVVAESLLVDHSQGTLQLTKTYASGHIEEAPLIGLGRAQVVLNEGITRQRVVVYMAIVVKGEVSSWCFCLFDMF